MKHTRFAQLAPESRVAPENRIYVNRNLRMETLGAIGFDLDHTLAHYRGPAVEELAYTLTRTRLVERFGYPEELLQVPYERTFVIRGLVVDKRRGHVLKMNYHNYVARAYHGRRRLGSEERKAAYRTGRVRMGGDAYVSVDTLFHLPEVYLFAVLVEMRTAGKLPRGKTFRRIYAEVREAIDSVHGDGSLKSRILERVDRFVRRDPLIARTLIEFRNSGKKVFLLTNSEFYYSDALLSHLLENGNGGRWGTYFDAIVVDAGKPVYFTDLSRQPRGEAIASPEGFPPIVRGGNARLLERDLGFAGDQILYFGDHTYGDILRSKKSLGWRTAMVVEELADELRVTRQVHPQLEELNHWASLRGVLEAELSDVQLQELKTARSLERKGVAGDSRKLEDLGRRRAELDEELDGVQRTASEIGAAINRAYNPYWGPLFREGREMSRFGHQVKDFACIYTTRVSNFLNYHPDHYFRSAMERMPHEIA